MNADKKVTERGRRWGWIGGGLGGLLWLIPLAVVAQLRGESVAAFAAGSAFFIGFAYVFICAPWRFPHRPFALIYLGLIFIIIAAAVLLLWLMVVPALGVGRSYSMLFPLVTLLIPLAIFGRRRWDELGPVLTRHDDGCGR